MYLDRLRSRRLLFPAVIPLILLLTACRPGLQERPAVSDSARGDTAASSALREADWIGVGTYNPNTDAAPPPQGSSTTPSPSSTITAESPVSNPQPAPTPGPQVYITVRGDTLRSVSGRAYGTRRNAQAIGDFNSLSKGLDEELAVGTQLRIPVLTDQPIIADVD